MIEPEPHPHDKHEGDEEKPPSDHHKGLHKDDPRVPEEQVSEKADGDDT